MKKILVAGVLGGITVYIWGAFSWMVLPWHNATIPQMPQGATVSQTLVDLEVGSGVYMYPEEEHAEAAPVAETKPAEPAEATESTMAEMAYSEESAEAVEESSSEIGAAEAPVAEAVVASKEGVGAPAATETTGPANKPYIFMLYVAEGFDAADPTPFINGFILAFVTASLAAYLLSLVMGSFAGFSQRLTFVVLIGLFAALVSHVSAWNWMLFPTNYTVVMALDLIIGWALAGAVIAWIIKPEEAAIA